MRRFGWSLVAIILVCVVSARAQILSPILNDKNHAAAPGGNIAFNAAADLGNISNCKSGTSFSASYTVGSGSNRLLVVAFLGDTGNTGAGGHDISSVTYNGVGLTLGSKLEPVLNVNDRNMYVYYLLNPASGANNVVVNCSGTGSGHYILANAADYTGVKQSSQPDATASADSNNSLVSSLTTMITIANANSWSVIFDQDSAGTMSAGAGVTGRSTCVAFGDCFLGDSNSALSTGSNNQTVNNSGTARMQSIAVSFVSN